MKFIAAIAILLFMQCDIVLHDIELSDDAFNDELPFHIETWYFEAIFDSNESMVFMLTCAGEGEAAILMTGISYYKNGTLCHEFRKLYLQPVISNVTPYIEAGGKRIMRGEEKQGKFVFTIEYVSPSISIYLLFENKSKGWKSDEWLAIPNMDVRGNIAFKGREKMVKGKGYHDHNIFFLRNPFLKRGYMDGKIIVANTSIVWAKLMDNLFMHEDFVVYSKGNYTLIKNAVIECSDYVINHHHIIPMTFHIVAQRENMSVDIVAEARHIHYIRLPLLHYWRYHVVCRGWIEKNGEREEIKSYDIAEYMLFA